MGEDEVLAAGLTDDLGIGVVVVDILADEFPEVLESVGASCEVNTSQMGRFERHFADHRATAGQEVDDTVGDACFLEQFH